MDVYLCGYLFHSFSYRDFSAMTTMSFSATVWMEVGYVAFFVIYAISVFVIRIYRINRSDLLSEHKGIRVIRQTSIL